MKGTSPGMISRLQIAMVQLMFIQLPISSSAIKGFFGSQILVLLAHSMSPPHNQAKEEAKQKGITLH